MRNVLLFLLLFLIGGNSYAAAIRLQVPANVVRAESGVFSASNSSVFSNGSFAANFITEVEGTSITFPQSMRTAANAASFITPILMPGPAGLLTSAVLSWLANYQLNYANNEWMVKPDPSSPQYNPYDPNQTGWGNNYYTTSPYNLDCRAWQCNEMQAAQADICNARCAPGYQPVVDYIFYSGTAKAMSYHWHDSCAGCTGPYRSGDAINHIGFNPNGGIPASNPGAPATQSDWDKVNNSTTPIPDAALNDLAKGGVAIPLSPSVDLTPKTVPLGVPVKDAVTNNYYQDRAQITPTSSTDPTQADLQVVKQQTDAAGNPATNPADNTAVPPAKADDPCAEHPNRVGCLEKDEVQTPDITQQAKTVTITPDSGWGADTAACPADVNLNLKAPGASGVALSWAPTCQFVDKLRPVILGLAWVTAVMLAIGIARKGGA